MKRIAVSVACALLAVMLLGTPAMAIVNPDNTPTTENIWVWRNVLETGDFFVLIYENTPYAVVPTDYSYSQAFVWRLVDTDNTTELGQALGYDFNDNGFNYNVVSFYFDAGNVTALGLTWGATYNLILSGTPSAFAAPPEYAYIIGGSSYSTLTATAAVKENIGSRILALGAILDAQWGLSTSLLTPGDIGGYLSEFGQSFFRGAIYGLQAIAPSIFQVRITDIDTSFPTKSTSYATNLTSQFAGNYLDTAEQAGEAMFGVNYNFMGLMLTLLYLAVIIGATWQLAGGNIWKGLVEGAAPLVIFSRMSVFGLGELSLIVALCWIFSMAKTWRVI